MARRIAVEIVGDSGSLERAFKRSGRAAGKFNSEITKAGKGRDLFGGLTKGAAGMAAGLVGITSLVAGFQKMITDASDLQESIGKTGVVFKGSSAEIVAWSKTTANAIGISQNAALEAAGTFGNMLVPMGVGRDKAADMSKAMVNLAGDMASFNNASPEETLQAIQSGLAGETEPLRRFGVFLNEARVKQEAFAIGVAKGAQAADNAKDAYKDASESFKTATKAQTKATRELASAESGLKSSRSAVISSIKGVESAQESLYQSTRSAADAQDQQKDSADRLTQAKLQLRDAQNASKTAQIALTDARKQAVAQLKELKDTAIDASLSEKRAELSLDQARQRLADTMKDSNATELDRRDALLSVREAERSLEDAQDSRKDLAKKIKDADKKGIEGSQQVIDARKGIADAHDAEEQAARGVAAASRAFADAQADVAESLRQVARSQQALATAQEKAQTAAADHEQAQARLATAQDNSRKANERAKTAEEALSDAKERSDRLNKGRVDGLTAEQKALATYSLILKDTKDQQGDAARTGENLAGKTRELQANVENMSAMLGAVFTPAILDVITQFSDWIGKSENQKAVMDILKTTVDVLKTAVDFLKGAFELLSGIVGGNEEAVWLLVAAYGAFKILKIADKVSTLTGNIGTLTTEQGKLRSSTRRTTNSFAGKAGLAAGVLVASIAVSDMIRQIPGWDATFKSFGERIYDVGAKLNEVAGRGADPLGLLLGGVGGLAAVRGSRQSPAAGVTGARAPLNINGPVHINGVTMKNLGEIEDGIHKRARQRPHRRRGS